MALYHDATVSPTKPELVVRWLSQQQWLDDSDAIVEPVGAYRFDDPEGRVGMETHIVIRGSSILQVPMTYRDAPLDGGDEWLLGTTEHTALGTRWVYDGLGDPRYRLMLAATSMTGQGEALGMVVYDGSWFIAPSAVRLGGGGWSGERVSVDDFAPLPGQGPADGATCVLRNDRFEMAVHRSLHIGPPPPIGLTAHWVGMDAPVVLTEVVEI